MESILTNVFGEDLFLIRILTGSEFDSRLIEYSNRDQHMAIRGTLDKCRLGSKWKKNDYFRELDVADNRHLPALGHYTDAMCRRRQGSPRLECATLALYFFAEEFREWRIQNTRQRTHYLIHNDFTGWQSEIVNWYNHVVSPKPEQDEDGDHKSNKKKTKPLYLWGGSSLDKSRFLYYLLLSNCYYFCLLVK